MYIVCSVYRPVQANMVPDRGAYTLFSLQQELNLSTYRGAHNSCQEDRIL